MAKSRGGRRTYKTKAGAKRNRKKGGALYKVRGGWRISYPRRRRRRR